MTNRSGCKSQALVQPPGPSEMVWVSSMSSSVPAARHARSTAARNPGSGSTMPMLVIAGSMMRTATSPCASPASTDAMSLNSAARVVSCNGTGAPTLPGRSRVLPAGPSTARVSSTDPW